MATCSNDICVQNNSPEIGIEKIISDSDLQTSSDSYGLATSKIEADSNRIQGREFYLYTAGDECEIVVAENISKMEFQVTILPDLTTQLVNKSQLKRLNNNYWKPLEKKSKELNEFIIILINSGDVELMKKAYNQFSILNYIIPSPFNKDKRKIPEHHSILHICARHGSAEMMKSLLELKSPTFPLDTRSNKFGKGNTILHAAVNEGNGDLVHSILKYNPIGDGERVTMTQQKAGLKRGTFGKSILHKSTIESKEVVILLDGKDLINLVNGNGEAVIHLCIQKQYYDLLRNFMNEGADLTIQDKYGHNVLHEAAIQNDVIALNMVIEHLKERGENGDNVLKRLLKTKNMKGAYPTELASEIELMKMLLNCIDDEAERIEQLSTLLALSTERNRIDIAKFLVSEGASIDFVSKQGMTPLKVASLRGYKELANYMLMEGGDPNHSRGSNSNAAINNAAKSGHIDLIKILLKHNATLWDDTMMEKSALHSAVNGGHSNLIRYLVLKNNMNPNIRDINGRTPLYYALEGGHRDCVKELLHCKADPELPIDTDGQKSIHFAVENNKKNILKILLDYGAMPDEKNVDGKTPFDIALENDFPNILKLLLDHGVRLEKGNNDLNTPMHIIAIFNSYKCADYLLREAKIKEAYDQLNVKNVDKETPIDIAKRRGHNSVLITYIEKANKDYFIMNPTIYHEFFEAGQYDILKKIFYRMCEENKKGTKVTCSPLMLDTNGKGESPFSKNFSHLLPSLLHNLIKCDDKELREHPIVKKTVEKKLNFYRIWYTLTFFAYLTFVILFSISLFLASYHCDSDLQGFESITLHSNFRIFLETLVWAFTIVLTFSELIEFGYGWSKILKSKRFMQKSQRVQYFMNKDADDVEVIDFKDQKNYFLQILEWGKKLGNAVQFTDRVFCYFPSAFLHYFYGSPLDILGIVSLFLYFIVRLAHSNIAWLFASLAYIAFILSLLKYTRIIPSLGAYIDTVKAVFSKDIPRFLVLYFIVLAAFIGGTHLAARFNMGETSQTTLLKHPGHPDILCVNDTTQMLFFNEEVTQDYTIFRPLITGLILLLDGGPGNREEEILNVNLFFTVVYIFFSFTIIVVLSNILIAQLSETYTNLNAQGTFYYRMGLIVTMELESSIAFFFGKYFRRLASTRTFNVPIDEWKKLLNETPGQSISSHLVVLEDKMNRNTVTLNEGNDKNLAQMEFLESMSEKLDNFQKKFENFQGQSDHNISLDSPNSEKPLPKESFVKVKMERRIEILESGAEEMARQCENIEKKLNQILKILKK